MVELALCAPILLGLLLGIIDAGWLYNHQLMLTNAAREGARLGAMGQSTSEIQSHVRDYLQQSGFTPVPTISQIGVDLSSGTANVALSVDVPCLFAISGPSVTMTASSKMRLE